MENIFFFHLENWKETKKLNYYVEILFKTRPPHYITLFELDFNVRFSFLRDLKSTIIINNVNSFTAIKKLCESNTNF